MNKNTNPWLLIVDDDEKNLYSTKRILEELNINIETVLSGVEALKSIVSRNYFLILMDVQMPGMSGFETASLIRCNKNYKGLPIIFQTAINKEDEYVLRGYKEGAVDYLFKPINPSILVSKVKVFLDLFNTKIEVAESHRELAHKKELETINKQLEDKIKELADYDVIVAHDLQGPLNNIKEFIQCLKEEAGSELNGVALGFLNRIEVNSTRAVEFVGSLLQYSNADKVDTIKTEFNFTECIEKSVSNLETIIIAKHAQINYTDIPSKLLGVPLKIQQVFQNLLSNGLKYQPKNVRPKIVIYERNQGNIKLDHKEIIVEDNGIGFSQEYAEVIFSPFKRLHRHDEFEGSGVGLATCKKIIDFHGWGIKAESEIGKGSKFIISIPLAPIDFKPAMN